VLALSLAIIIIQAPLGVQMVSAALMQHSRDLEEAGRIAGAGPLHRLRRIVVPLTVPTLLTVGLLVFAAAARDVAAITLLTTGNMRTLSLLTIDYVATPDLGAASVSGFLLVILITLAAAVYAVLTRRRAF
jgi:ABC-type Fe3+ transport system permease subunit